MTVGGPQGGNLPLDPLSAEMASHYSVEFAESLLLEAKLIAYHERAAIVRPHHVLAALDRMPPPRGRR